MNRAFIFAGGSSKRYHTLQVHKEQTIAEHSFGVAWLVELITLGSASKNLIMAALAHDLAEHVVGDIPSPAKRMLSSGNEFAEIEASLLFGAGLNYEDTLTDEEKVILKLADMLEGVTFCVRERRLGNRGIGVVFNRFREYTDEVLIENHLLLGPAALQARDILNELSKEWKESNHV